MIQIIRLDVNLQNIVSQSKFTANYTVKVNDNYFLSYQNVPNISYV